MSNPVPAKAFVQPSPEAAILFAPIGHTPPVPSFLLVQNL